MAKWSFFVGRWGLKKFSTKLTLMPSLRYAVCRAGFKEFSSWEFRFVTNTYFGGTDQEKFTHLREATPWVQCNILEHTFCGRLWYTLSTFFFRFSEKLILILTTTPNHIIMNKRKQRKWFPRGYQHSRNSTLKSRLRDLLRKKKPREEKEEQSSPQLSDENPPTSLPTSSSFSVTKSTTHEDIQNQDKKKIKLKNILNKFRLEISKHEKSVSNSFEADPYVV